MKRRLQAFALAGVALIGVAFAAAALNTLVAEQPDKAQAPMSGPLPETQSEPPPERPSAPVVEKEAPPRACLGCHGLSALAYMRQGEEGWRDIVDYMVLHGAYMTQEEYEAAVSWLVRNYGPAPPREQPANAGPQNPELDLVVKKCTTCHSLERVTQQARTPAEWANIVSQMRAIGAPVCDSEADQIVRYLGENYGIVNHRN